MSERIQHTPERQRFIEERLVYLNQPLARANLRPLFTASDVEVADASQNRTELLSTERVIPFSRDRGLYFAIHPALFRKEPKARGQFLPIYLTEQAAERNNILVEIVGTSDGAMLRQQNRMQMSEPVIGEILLNTINAELSNLQLATLPRELFAVKGPFVVRDYRIIDTNKRFYSGLVLDVEKLDGTHGEIPILINANSGKGRPDEGSHGTVYVVEVGDKIVLGKQYRPLVPQEDLPKGQIDNIEIPRGFPKAILDNLSQLKEELNLSEEDIRQFSLGVMKQDPTTDYVTPLFMAVKVNQEAVNKINSSGAGFESIVPFRASKQEVISMIEKGEIWDAHSVAGIAAYLLKSGILTANPSREVERLGVVLKDVFQVQYGKYLPQVLRGEYQGEMLPGKIAVDSGKARIFPEIDARVTNNKQAVLRRLESQHTNLRVVPVVDAINSIANGEYDIVTASALIKSFLPLGILTLRN